MLANLKSIGYMNENTASNELKRNLTEVKRAAELLLNLMDLIIERIHFEPGEVEKFVTLRQAILDFGSIEVNPGIPKNIIIDSDNIERLQKEYGAITDACQNTLINDMIRDYIIRTKRNNKN